MEEMFAARALCWTSTVAQQMKEPTAKPHCQILIPGTNVVEGESQLQQVILLNTNNIFMKNVNVKELKTRILETSLLVDTYFLKKYFPHSSAFCREEAINFNKI